MQSDSINRNNSYAAEADTTFHNVIITIYCGTILAKPVGPSYAVANATEKRRETVWGAVWFSAASPR